MSIASIALSPSLEEVVNFSGIIRRFGLNLDDPILIFLTIAGSLIPMRVMESDSLASIKRFKGFFVKKQKLVTDRNEVARNDHRGLADGKVLHLVIKLSDLQAILIKTVDGKELELLVERNRNVGYVKQQIASKENEAMNLWDHELTLDGEKLDDQKLINDLCKNGENVIRLLIRKLAKPKAFLVEPVVVNPEIKLSPSLKDLISSTLEGLEKGNDPIRSSDGSGGAYFMKDPSGENFISVFKPIDEEPMAINNPHGLAVSVNGEGLKKGTQVGEGALREVAAYILDYPITGLDKTGFAGVPPTTMVKCLHKGFNHPNGYHIAPENMKIGSLQTFVSNIGTCEDMGYRTFPIDQVHKISVLDIRLANADRHAGNILVSRDGPDGRIVLTPIDHGYCFPNKFEDCTFEWLYWPQAKEPYSPEILDYITSLDPEQDIELLRLNGWEISSSCARVLRISTMLLKNAVAKGLTPFTIGSIMCRVTLEKESMIEEIIHEAETTLPESATEDEFISTVSAIMERRLDQVSQK